MKISQKATTLVLASILSLGTITIPNLQTNYVYAEKERIKSCDAVIENIKQYTAGSNLRITWDKCENVTKYEIKIYDEDKNCLWSGTAKPWSGSKKSDRFTINDVAPGETYTVSITPYYQQNSKSSKYYGTKKTFTTTVGNCKKVISPKTYGATKVTSEKGTYKITEPAQDYKLFLERNGYEVKYQGYSSGVTTYDVYCNDKYIASYLTETVSVKKYGGSYNYNYTWINVDYIYIDGSDLCL